MKQVAMKRLASKKRSADAANGHLADAMAIHGEMLRHLSQKKSIGLLDIGELMEHIGNRYLDIAETVRQDILRGLSTARNRNRPSNDE